MKRNILSDYKKLLIRGKDLVILSSVQSLIQWDMETMMPPKAVEQRSQQLALLSLISHKMSTGSEIGRLLNAILTSPQYDSLSEVEKRNIHLIKKNYDEQTALPEKLVAEIAKQRAITINTWKKAKKAKKFAVLQPELEKLVALTNQAAQILMQVNKTATPYDALLDIYETKMTSDMITTTFNQLQIGLATLLDKIENSPNQRDISTLRSRISVEKQRKIAQALAQTLGYDTTSSTAGGRIDETEHPFTSGYYDDVRVTTHYYPDNFTSSIFSVLHETGHAIYEQNMNQDWKYQPVGSSCSYGIHESQSRLYENIIGRSKEFWVNMLPKLKQITAPTLSNVSLSQFVHTINKVKPSKIRIEADEVTYNLHVIIRFQIEKDIFTEKIHVSELSETWNQKYRDSLGVNIENDSEGVMQDTHWASGFYGYFPTYALGNIYSGQLLATLKNDIQDWRTQLAQGNLKCIRAWLTKNVHSYGDLYDPADLIMRIAGKKLDAEPYLEYLREKYSELYGF
ncbi:MAG: carboxypeptidase M32 [Candidatus Bathyarchaeota archaeon]|nr:carboxypeptidase M32 [Candidatus Bathyarchaeota archaeon]